MHTMFYACMQSLYFLMEGKIFLMSTKKALFWIVFWFVLAVLFDSGIYFFLGKQKALEFLGGYVIEQSLSMDNLFLFLMIFSCYGIPAMYQRRVLTYGIFGAVVLRLIFILLGLSIIKRFHWVLYIFGFILLISGFKMFSGSDENQDFKESRLLTILGKIIPITNQLYGEQFFVRVGRLCATPLFAILVLIEGSDLLFAIDSIPAVFSISTDTFIVYTSNIFAILGLRNMYFLLEKMHSAFRFVKYGVALILIFTGIKLLLLIFSINVSITLSLGIIIGTLLLSIVISLLFPEKRSVRYKNA